MNVTRVVQFVLAALACCASSTAQFLISTPAPQSITVGGLDPIMAKARNDALKAKDPHLEFEEVRLYIQKTVDALRYNNTQEVAFDNRDSFRAWLRGVSRRVERPYSELVQGIVDSVGPNPCPDLTGEDPDSPNYIRDEAMRNLEKARTAPAPPETEPSPVPGYATRAAPDSVLPPSSHPARVHSTPRPAPGDPTAIKIEWSDGASTKSASRPAKLFRLE